MIELMWISLQMLTPVKTPEKPVPIISDNSADETSDVFNKHKRDFGKTTHVSMT